MMNGIACTSKPHLDGARCECGLPLDEELVVVGGDELDVHRLGALAATDPHRIGSGSGRSGGLHVLAHAD